MQRHMSCDWLSLLPCRVATNPVLINHPDVVVIPIVECGEPLVRVVEYQLIVLDRGDTGDEPQYLCREGVAHRLLVAQNCLPAGIRIGISECFRPVSLQQKYWDRTTARLVEEHPEWTEQIVADEAAKFVAPPWIVPPHCTGGAVDVVLLDASLTEMDMGCALDQRCPEMRTRVEGISDVAQHNRHLLVNAMEEAGFVNYGHEWWHYSYGDRYWAYQTKAPSAIYAAVACA
jgi:zinc D-Ala-D-Ala dipeptidase